MSKTLLTLIATLLLVASAVVLLRVAVLLTQFIIALFRKVPYTIEEIEDPPGQQDYLGVGAVVRARMVDELRYANMGPRTLTRASTPDVSVPAPVLPLHNSASWLNSLFSYLSFENKLSVSTRIIPVDANQAAVHVRIVNARGKVLDSVRIGQRVVKGRESEGYSRIGVFSGAWLVYALSWRTKRSTRIRHNSRTKIFGTDSWESYGKLSQSLRYAHPESVKIAWCHEALREDHRNVGALMELGRLKSHIPESPQSMHDGIYHLCKARDFLQESREGMRRPFRAKLPLVRADPMWFQTMYLLTVAHLNMCHYLENRRLKSGHELSRRQRIKERKDMLTHLKWALALGLELARTTGATQLALNHPMKKWIIKPGVRNDMAKLLNREDLDLASLVAGAIAFMEGPLAKITGSEGVPEGEPCGSLGATAATRSMKENTMEVTWTSVHHISASLKDVWNLLAELPAYDPPVKGRPSIQINKSRLPSASEILKIHDFAFREVRSSEEDPRAHLNFKPRYQAACLYMTLGQPLNAVDELRKAFYHFSAMPPLKFEEITGFQLWEWAMRDPALDQLRDSNNIAHAAYVNLINNVREKLNSPTEIVT